MSTHIENKLKNGEKLRLFITGATGYIGQVVTEKAVAEGYEVHGLSRTEEGVEKLKKLGAVPVRGDITTLDVLERESAAADAVLHLAYNHDFGADADQVARGDMLAVDALSRPLKGTDKPIITTSGCGSIVPDKDGNETDETAPIRDNLPVKGRVVNETRSLAMEGVRSMSLRLAPYVYGRGGTGFLVWQMSEAVKHGESIYIGDGSYRTSTIHVDDCARLYLATMKYGRGGEIYNGTSQTDVSLKEMAEAIGKVLDLPVRSVGIDEAREKWGPFLTWFNYLETRASSRKARDQLRWEPVEIDYLSDITSGSYPKVAEGLKSAKL